MYKSTDKICDLMSHEEDAIQIISRFGLEMGVGDQTIEQVCKAHDVHTPTFLAIVNYKVFHQQATIEEINIDTLQRYLKNAHTYFLDFRLPRLRRDLIEAIIPADPTTKIPGLILRCYDEFVDEIRTHIEHENKGLYDEHEHDDQRITDKLTEIKNLIIKYYPTKPTSTEGTVTYTLISVMSELWHTEQDSPSGSDTCPATGSSPPPDARDRRTERTGERCARTGSARFEQQRDRRRTLHLHTHRHFTPQKYSPQIEYSFNRGHYHLCDCQQTR